ncbi:T6SS immunity protein Tli4 family protein [Rubrivivax gelatinosus]|uniref:T6SS immunity protein Tli4 family protein n=1 Tax=Rubrivivax gelatinosus TaxID=28068 RepID=UPI00190868B0|nr:T6SS immunity protein Tli4 family protein [Rubrivivax gelatinosus]
MSSILKLQLAWPSSRKLLLAVAATLGALPFLPDLIHYRQTHPERTHAMTELTRRMKTMCIGRHALDVPIAAEIAIGDSRIEVITIERVPSFPSNTDYAGKMQNHERSLRAAAHETEGSRLRAVRVANGGSLTIFVSRERERGVGMSVVEGFSFASPSAWRLHYRTSDETVAAVESLIADIASKLTPRAVGAIPTSDGACIADGLLRRKPEEAETFSGGARDQSLSWTLNFTSETRGDYAPNERLFARVDRAIAMAGSGSGIKTLRRATLTVAGRSAQEYVALYPEKGGTIFDAKLETYGTRSPMSPMVKLSLEVGWPDKQNPQDPRKFLTQEQALELWDAIVKSVGLRPGAF